MKNLELKRIVLCVAIPFLIVLAITIVFLLQEFLLIEGSQWGIYPRMKSGLFGILLAPLVHADWSHLLSNLISLFLLATAVFYFYRDLGLVVILVCWIAGGSLTWLFGRESFHIGASGIVYGLASFLFFSGIVRQNIQLLAVSLVMVVQYGGLVWGLLPTFKELSFESHIFGGTTGFLLAFILRNHGPKLPVNVWNRDYGEDDSDDYSEGEPEFFDDETDHVNDEKQLVIVSDDK